MKTWWKVGKRRQRNRNPMKTHWNNVKLRQMPPLHYPGSMGTCVILQNAPQQRGRSIDERRWSMRRTTCPHHLRSPSLTHSIRQTIRSMSTDTAAPPCKTNYLSISYNQVPSTLCLCRPAISEGVNKESGGGNVKEEQWEMVWGGVSGIRSGGDGRDGADCRPGNVPPHGRFLWVSHKTSPREVPNYCVL